MRRRGLIGALVGSLLWASAGTAWAVAPAASVALIVRTQPGGGPDAARIVRANRGVWRSLGIGRLFGATVSQSALPDLLQSPAVESVVPDTRVALAGVDGQNVSGDLGGLTSVARLIGADDYWNAGFTGRGVDVALIDSGVVPVKGLTSPGKIVNGPDLSFESQDPDLRYLDTFGHGTHMAGIIAGRDPGSYDVSASDNSHFVGIAPGARVLSVKVADSFGTTDVSQVIAAIGWVVEHRRDNDLDVRVLNLSFGTDGVQSYRLDPLAYAVEDAWHRGIFVVVAAGNDGYGDQQLNNPAYDPYVMAVGATGRRGTATRADDKVADFSSVGDDRRHPDVVAPGTSILSLRDPGSYVDQRNPSARVGDTPRLFRGSGTSQAAAVVSGAAALIIDQRPNIKPDQLKALLRKTAFDLDDPSAGQGAGLIDLARARTISTPAADQNHPRAAGGGTLEKARGTLELLSRGVPLQGERDIFGNTLNLVDWLLKTVLGVVWVGGRFLGVPWTGSCWCEDTWAGPAWEGRSWTDNDWSGRSWTSDAWKGRSWTTGGWTGGEWNGRSWTSDTWYGDTWSSAGWGT
jgi:serine protease AprX